MWTTTEINDIFILVSLILFMYQSKNLHSPLGHAIAELESSIILTGCPSGLDDGKFIKVTFSPTKDLE